VGRSRVTGLAVSPDGRRLAAATALGGAELRPLSGRGPPIPVGPASGTRGLAWSRRGSVLAVAGADGVLRIADPATGKVVRSVTTTGLATGLDVSPDGSRIAVAGTVGVIVYASRTGAKIVQLRNDDTTSAVAFDPRNPARLADATADYKDNGALSLLKVRSDGTPFLRFALPNSARVVAFSPDGRLLLGATLADTTVKLFDIARRREVRDLFGHTGRVTAAAFSPDGRLVATASVDRTVRIWDPATGSQLRVIDHANPVTGVAFTPGGRDVVSGDDRGTVRVWDACTGCRNAAALLAVAHRRVTRSLTPVERRTFLGGPGG
jgi:WD40 repeat protein